MLVEEFKRCINSDVKSFLAKKEVETLEKVSKKRGSDYPKLRQLMLVEEFKRCINSDVKSFLAEKEVETLEKANRLADDYTLTHKVSFVSKANPRKTFYPRYGHKPSLVSNLVIPIRMLPNPNLLVKTKVTIPYLSLFAIIANNQVILFLIVLF